MHFDMEICKLIIENVDDKNPADRNGMTPLHRAAEYGHLDICKLIIQNVEDKNPPSNDRSTPLHWAAENGHLEVP